MDVACGAHTAKWVPAEVTFAPSFSRAAASLAGSLGAASASGAASAGTIRFRV